MSTPPKTKFIAYTGLILIWLYTFYVSVLNPPFFGYYTVDEKFIADSGVFLWYGVTPTSLEWPATPSSFSIFIVFATKVLWGIGAHRDQLHGILDIFERFDWEAYQYLFSRKELLLVGRTIQLIAVAWILVSIIRFLYRNQHEQFSTLNRSVLVFLVISAGMVWINAPVLRPEALSGCLFSYLFIRMAYSKQLSSRECYLLSLLFGIIMAERLLFVFVTPLVFGGFFIKSAVRKWQITGQSLLIFLGAFVIFCPFLLTDPLVVLKSFFGGILVKVQDQPMDTFFNHEFIRVYFSNWTHYPLLVFCLIGGVLSLKQRQPFVILALVNLLLFLTMVLHSSQIYITHVLPAGSILLFLASIGISYIAGLFGARQLLVATLLTLPIVAANLYEYYTFQRTSHRSSTIEMAYHWINTLPANTRLLVHPELEFYLTKNKATLLNDFKMNQDSLLRLEKLNYLMGKKSALTDQIGAIPLVTRSFAFEDESLREVQYQLLIKYSSAEPRKGYQYSVYMDNTRLVNHSLQTQDAIERFRKGEFEYMITDIALDFPKPVQTFANTTHPTLYCYKYTGTRTEI